MNPNRGKKYIGRNATLIVGREGITIERPARFALQHGGERRTTVRYKDLAEMRHRQASIRPGYLQFSTKHGVEGVTPLSRVNKIHFTRDEAHQFRRARDVINANIQNIQESGGSGVPDLMGDSGGPTIPNRGLSFRRRF